jgi:glycosyltransferase involved in cell wall biosynthesis
MITLRRWSNAWRRFMTYLKELGFDVVREIRAEREVRMRRLPPLRIGSGTRVKSALSARGSEPTVYYLCAGFDRPTGGNRTIYRHVDALNSAGIPAVVVHHQSGFACTWFEHSTPVMGAKDVALAPRDVLVVPEYYGPGLHRLPAGPRIVIFNQNAYRTFAGIRLQSPGARYRDIVGIEAILVVSRDSADYLRYAFPGLRVERVPNAVDGQIFYPLAAPPDRRVAVMPRRRPADCAQVLHLLRARGCLDSWEIVEIDGRSERETADLLRSCAIFLSFSEQEGFGMPPAEAMACGCYVIGFTGLGGREIFDPATSTPIEEGDVLAMAKAAERALRAGDRELRVMRQRALEASARILGEYSLDNQRADLLAFFAPLLSRDGRGAITPRPSGRRPQTMAAPERP